MQINCLLLACSLFLYTQNKVNPGCLDCQQGKQVYFHVGYNSWEFTFLVFLSAKVSAFWGEEEMM